MPQYVYLQYNRPLLRLNTRAAATALQRHPGPQALCAACVVVTGTADVVVVAAAAVA